jgi:hypothetical protein
MVRLAGVVHGVGDQEELSSCCYSGCLLWPDFDKLGCVSEVSIP